MLYINPFDVLNSALYTIDSRCSSLLPQDILVPGAFSRPGKAIWSPSAIVRQLFSLQEGSVCHQLLLSHNRLKNELSSMDWKSIPNQEILLDKANTFLSRIRMDQAPTASGFCQARNKLNSQVVLDILQEHTDFLVEKSGISQLKELTIYIDGTNVPITPNLEEPDNVVPTKGTPRGAMHLNAAMCPELNNMFVAFRLQKFSGKNEHSAALDMVRELHCKYPDKKLTVIMDRGYFSYELVTYCQKHNIQYLIRMKKKIFMSLLGVEDCTEEVDTSLCVNLSYRWRKAQKQNPDKYRHIIHPITVMPDKDSQFRLECRLLSAKTPADILSKLDTAETGTDNDEHFSYFITNIFDSHFKERPITTFYFNRWQIESGYGHLKYKAGLLAMHSKSENKIRQEIWISLLRYNMISSICSFFARKVLKKKRREKKRRTPRPVRPGITNPKPKDMAQDNDGEYVSKVSFAEASRCFFSLLKGEISLEDMEGSLERSVVYTIQGRHRKRGGTITRMHPFCWSFH